LRSSYVVDRDGNVAWAVHHAYAHGRDLDEHLKQLRSVVG
jgi:mycoredoxin-dependent peroxiredoxin